MPYIAGEAAGNLGSDVILKLCNNIWKSENDIRRVKKSKIFWKLKKHYLEEKGARSAHYSPYQVAREAIYHSKALYKTYKVLSE